MGWNSLGLTHDFMRRYVRPGAFCIDATAGKGRDTVLLAKLCGPTGRVLAMDIQPAAVEATRALCRAEGVEDRVEILLQSHEHLGEMVPPDSADCVVFNLGWLPGEDHGVFTTRWSSIPALEGALLALRPGGVLSLCIYYGRRNGYEERDAVLEWLTKLDSRVYNVLRVDFPNRGNDPPIPVFILKEG